MQDIGNIFGAISPGCQQTRQADKIGDSVEVIRALFPAVTTVEIGTYSYMQGITGDLTDMIHMIDHYFQFAMHGFRL